MIIFVKNPKGFAAFGHIKFNKSERAFLGRFRKKIVIPVVATMPTEITKKYGQRRRN